MAASKYTIIAAAFWLGWVRRNTDTAGLARTVAWIWLVFFSVATGIAPQYFVWLAPFLLLAAPRWLAAFVATGSLGLFAFYNSLVHTTTIGGKFVDCNVWTMPWNDGFKRWYYAHSDQVQIAYHGPWQIPTWLVCVCALFWLSRKFLQERKAAEILECASTPKQQIAN